MPVDDLKRQIDARRSLPPVGARRLLRMKVGVTLGDVARACGVSVQSVSLWERGLSQPRGANLIAYADTLEVFRRSIVADANVRAGSVCETKVAPTS